MLGPKKSRSFNRVDVTATKVCDLQNHHYCAAKVRVNHLNQGQRVSPKIDDAPVDKGL